VALPDVTLTIVLAVTLYVPLPLLADAMLTLGFENKNVGAASAGEAAPKTRLNTVLTATIGKRKSKGTSLS
jgi:hypothetical protein